jgi:hypothetical protein
MVDLRRLTSRDNRRPVVVVSSCPDCDAWGVTARYGWMCVACRSHREKYGAAADCPTCGRHVPLGVGGSCRMCHKQRHLAARQLGVRIETLTLAEANARGQQLFIAGTHRPAGTRRREYQKKTVPADMSLLAYHAVRIHQLRDLKLTDFHDRRLHLGGQTILLADPVRDRLRAYLDHRGATWPATINPHLFVHVRSWAHTRPVTKNWAHDQLGMSGQQICLDRIF